MYLKDAKKRIHRGDINAALNVKLDFCYILHLNDLVMYL